MPGFWDTVYMLKLNLPMHQNNVVIM